MEESEWHNGSCPVEIDRSKEVKAERSKLRSIAYLNPGVMALFRPVPQPRAVSALLALL